MAPPDTFSLRLETKAFAVDSVQVRAVRGREAISELSSFEVAIVSTDRESPALEEMVGADVCLVFERDGLELRRVHGVVTEATDRLDPEADHRSFDLRIAPSAWRMSLVETQSVHLDVSVPDLIRNKLELVGLGARSAFRLLGTYPERELIVQYRESDLAFLTRLAEHLGVSFFFEQEEEGDKIVFTDHNGGFASAPDEPVRFRGRGEERDVFSLERRKTPLVASYVVHDYNYRNPLLDLMAATELQDAYGGGVVEYGAHVKTAEEAKLLANVRAEERRSASEVFLAVSDVCSLGAGSRFRLSGHPLLDETTFLVVEIEHTASLSVLTHGGAQAEPVYRSTFRAVRADVPFRPARKTLRPRITGVLSGVVESADVGDQARIDTKGRYQVSFHFDLVAAGRPKPSRPVRMAQPHAGPGYGMHFPLKPGTEVLMAFVDGDPDRPIIVGAVPNEVTPSPVTAANAHVNQLRTVSGILIELDDRA